MARSHNILDELVRRRERRWFNDGWSCTAVPQSALGSIVLRAALAGGSAGARADADLDAIVALFRAAEQFTDRLPLA